MSSTQITAVPGVPQIIITREFDAPAELLLRAYTDPELLVKWLGPRRMRMRLERFEPHAGGSWRFVHIDEDGNEYGFRGVYHGEPSVRDGITQTFEYEGAPGHVSLESMRFEERDGRTVLRNNAVYQSIEDRDAMIESGMESGLEESMEQLDELLATLTPAR